MAILADFMSAPSVQALAGAALAFGLCAAILWVLIKTGFAWRLATDVPNERSLHTLPTPRVGGWGIVPVVVALVGVTVPSLRLVALLAALLAALSQIDDRRGLPVWTRFGAHIAAVVAIVVVYPAAVPWWMLAGLAFLMVWLVNLYNFMDGSDGLAGGMALFGFGGYAVATLTAAHPAPALAIACAFVAGAAAGFLLFNFHPARVFLGDAGSVPLGFLAGAFGYLGWRDEVWPLCFPAMVFSPFIADASVTLMRRLLRGEKVWQAHREHYYQRMVRLGMGHARTAVAWYAVMFLGIILAVSLLHFSAAIQWAFVAAWAVVLVMMGVAVDICWRRSQSFLAQKKGVDADASQ